MLIVIRNSPVNNGWTEGIVIYSSTCLVESVSIKGLAFTWYRVMQIYCYLNCVFKNLKENLCRYFAIYISLIGHFRFIYPSNVPSNPWTFHTIIFCLFAWAFMSRLCVCVVFFVSVCAPATLCAIYPHTVKNIFYISNEISIDCGVKIKRKKNPKKWLTFLDRNQCKNPFLFSSHLTCLS